MSDRAILFLFSVLIVVGALGVVIWLFLSGQVRHMDGLFLLTACLVLLGAFGLYLRFLYRRAAESLASGRVRSTAAGTPAEVRAEGGASLHPAGRF